MVGQGATLDDHAILWRRLDRPGHESARPSTNLLPVRRLGLAIGQEAAVQAAWLRFPDFALEPLEQRYRRLDVLSYRYESAGAGGRFVTELAVNAAGLVTRYPDVWEVEAGA